LLKSVEEKQILIQELYHRVRNNLQVVRSMLNSQARTASVDEVKEFVRSADRRISAMALAHDQLMESQDLRVIDGCKYMRNLAVKIFDAYSEPDSNVELRLHCSDVKMDLATAGPAGLLISEIISNSLRHAFPEGKSGIIELSLNSEDGKMHLVISDNGIGFN